MPETCRISDGANRSRGWWKSLSDIEGRGRTAPVLVVCLLVLGACSSDERRPGARRGSTSAGSSASPKEELKKRKATRPAEPGKSRKASVRNDAFGAAKGLTRRAIRDLKKMGFWDDLTRKIAVIRVSSRQGPGSLPSSGHIANSLWTYYRDDATGEWGDLCDLLFYTDAVKRDVARQRVYHSQGRLDHPPPTVAQFWAVLLAHEIAHCSKRGQRGEAYSTKWEAKVLEGYGIARVGSP